VLCSPVSLSPLGRVVGLSKVTKAFSGGVGWGKWGGGRWELGGGGAVY